MRSTLTDIAREAGVSPATVDRVLNSRPGVRDRTREIVWETARRLGYVSNGSEVSRDLSADARQVIRLDIVLPAGTNTFMKSLNRQISTQSALRKDLDVHIHSIEGFNPDALARTLQEMQDSTQGVGLIALDHPTVREAIRSLKARDIKVVTLVSDIHNVPREAYVGIDNRAAGRLAGYLLGRFLATTETKKVALFAGSLSYRGHEEREMGFRHVLSEEFPHLSIVELREMKDDRDRAFQEASSLLERHGDLAAIYNVGAGNTGIARALKERGLDKRVIFIGHEATEANKILLLDGTLDAAIDQNPRVEARETLNILSAAVRGHDYHFHPPRLQVIFRENIPDD